MTLNHVFIIFVARYILEIESDNVCRKTICNPRAGDLLIGRESFLRASSTCGLTNSERYCVVTTSDSGRKSKCTICDSKNPYQRFSSTHSHRIENVVSRLPQDPFRWWQSMSGVHNVSIEISFESEFQFTFTHLRFKTYRPAAMYIERSKDYGRTWNKYAYFSDNCPRDFPSIPERKRSNINEVLCTSEFSSIIPSEGGTVLFSADTSDWVNNDVYWNKKRNDVTAITNIRVQFVRLHTFGDWKVDDNPNIRNKYYYAISEWIIRGRCSCYGHASKCKAKEGQVQVKEMVYGVCDCQHNTKGQHCEKCKDFYNDSPWLPADKNSTNECRKCECNSHSSSCHFDPVVYQQSRKMSGGVCDNCQHNTESKNCERCKSGYYRNIAVAINSSQTCLKCHCDSLGTKFPSICIQEPELDLGLNAGHCICKENVEGNQCDKCKIGFWKFNGNEETGCLKCNCVMMGTLENRGCDSSTGKCYCKSFVTGNDCSTCKIGYFNLSNANINGCSLCKCSEYGSRDNKTCDKYSGKCLCKNGFAGIRCDEIKSEWYIEKPTYPLEHLKEIKINLPPVSKSGYYNFVITTDTKNMQFFDSFIIVLSIYHVGKSSCQSYQDTMQLIKDSRYIVIPNKCLEKDLPIVLTVFTIESNNKIPPPSIIDIVVIPLLDVNSTKTRKVLGECLNYANLVSSKKCDFLNAEISTNTVTKSDPIKCKCNVTGSRNNNCNKIGGQCQCLPNVSGKTCERCASESYGFDARGCKKCKCDLTGSLNSQCYNDTGKCLCREGVEGQHCDTCKPGYWNFPFCHSCKCNQMSTTCDSKTGKCLNCKGNSFGYNCQNCENGYYGDTSRGILCKKCQCPGLSSLKNNSIGCSLIFNTTAFTCMCKKGYSGQFCDQCETNHFGNAISKDGTCQPCRCSGNIDQRIEDSCNSKTGECRKCLYNTSGFNCEKCVSGYFGNGAVRTCTKCVCNHMGTNPKWQGICNHETGKCPCLPNVVGLQCDRCQDKFFNLSSQIGCLPCNCDYPIGALNHSCNQLTGQCYCQAGRSGKMCNNCKDGFWGDPTKLNGCTKCYCNLDGSVFKQCNRNNGVCRCKPGITGRNCDMCMKGTDGKMPNCSSCGDCWLQWDHFLIVVKNTFDKLHNSSGVFMSNVKFPKEIDDVCTSLEQNMKSLKEIKKYFPIGYDIIISNFSEKLSRLKYYVYNSNIIDFNTQKNSIITIENSTDYAKAMISKNKIRDVTGAFNELKKSLKNILNGASESKKIYQNITFIKDKLFYRNEELRNINLKFIRQKSKDMDNLINEMSKNVITFNGVTCNTITESNPLMCSEFCGGVGCKPDKCYRHAPMNKYCMGKSNQFFNLYASLLIDRTNMSIILKEFNQQFNISINSKEIKDAYVKPESEYNTTIKLIDVTSGAIQSRRLESVNLLIKIKTYLNGSADLKDFESLIENINKFEINFKENEIIALDKQIRSRIRKLNNVNNILDKSKFNRKQCDVFKKSAVRAKEDTSYLLNSIKNISTLNRMTQKFEIIMKQFVMNFANALFSLKGNLFHMFKNENEAFQKQNNISYVTERIKFLKLYIMKIHKVFSNTFQQIKIKQEFQKAKLRNLKIDTKVVVNKSNYFKLKRASNSKISERFQSLLNKSHNLNDKIKASHYKLKLNKKLILDKELKLQSLSKDIDEKLSRLLVLQDKIYSKSEFHAQCLP